MILESFQLDGKNALVTGSSRGLGAAIALALAQAGANVGTHGRSMGSEATCERIRRLGKKSFYLSGDVATPEVCSALIQTTVEEFGSIDILVNNAGVIRRAPAADFLQADWDELIAVNLSAVFRLSQLAGQHMFGRNSKGKILNIASLLSFQGEFWFRPMPPRRVEWPSSPKRSPMSGRRRASTSTRLRQVTWPRITRRHCETIRNGAGKFLSASQPADGARPAISQAQRFFFAPRLVTTSTGMFY